MLNFAVGESNEIRIAVHDIFIRLSCQWKENTNVVKSITGNFKHSITSCELAKVIIESLLEILSISSQIAVFSDKVDSTTMSGYKTNARIHLAKYLDSTAMKRPILVIL